MRKPNGLITAAFAGGALILAGCTGSPGTSDPADSATDPGATSESDSTSSAGDPVRIVQAISGDPSTLDPRMSFEERSAQYVANVYQTLVGFELTESADGLLVADSESPTGSLAEAIDVSDDGLVYTFTLHDAVFHSGNPVTSQDVKWSLERAWEIQEGGWFDLDTIGLADPTGQIDTPDDQTVVLNMTRATPFTLQMLANPTVAIYDSVLMQENATEEDPWAQEFIAANDAGSGPYELASFSPGVELVLTRFEDYYGEAPEIDEVVMRVVPSASDQVALLQRGDIDIAAELPLSSLESLSSSDGVTVRSVPSNAQVSLMMNNVDGPTEDPAVRRAVAYAMPYDEIAANVFFGEAHSPSGPIPDLMPGFDVDAALYTQDLDRAGEELASSSYPDGFTIGLTYDSSATGYEQLVIAIQQALGEIGITVEAEPMTTAQFNEAFFSGETPMFLFSSLSWVNNPSYHLDLFWAIGSYGNRISYSNAEVDALKELAFEHPIDSNEALEYFSEIQALMLTDSPAAFLTQVNWTLGMTSRIEAYEVRTDQIIRFETMRLTD